MLEFQITELGVLGCCRSFAKDDFLGCHILVTDAFWIDNQLIKIEFHFAELVVLFQKYTERSNQFLNVNPTGFCDTGDAERGVDVFVPDG